ncbi:MAG: putative drug exporter of the superfamily [Thermoleophilaceae bacterium]|nr:putative drug exporter of the superfamily [Thermoleophilaceae bacterium]
MEAWTRRIIRNRRKVIAAWLVLFVIGGAATSSLADLLSNRFSVPGSEAEKGRQLLSKTMGEKGDGDFTLVVQATGGAPGPELQAKTEDAARRAAGKVKGAKAGPVQSAGHGVTFVQIPTPLEAVDAAKKTKGMRAAIGKLPGARTYLSGYPAILEDTKQINSDDIARGESIAIPVAIIVLAFMFGTLGSIFVPLAFAAVTIPTALGIVWIFAHVFDMATYVTQIVALIGLAIAIDYSMLVVFRYREELDTTEDPHEALVRSMTTAGRATLFSGLAVAFGLALLVVMPLPFMRSMGIGGLMAPLVSIAAAATFLPALLATLGRGVNRFRFIPRRILERRAHGEGNFWHRLATSIMRRPLVYMGGAACVLLALALLATGLHVTGGSDSNGIPKNRESTRGLAVLEKTIGPGALAPNQIVIDTGRPGGAFTPAVQAAEQRLVASLRGDPEVKGGTVLAPATLEAAGAVPQPALRQRLLDASLVDRSGRVAQVRAAAFHDSGTNPSKNLVKRIRDDYVPAAGFGSAQVYVTGQPAFGVDVVDKAYASFPWLVAAVLVLTYLLLLRAFRSVFLPLKAVVMNVLSVGATYGVLVLVFQHGWGEWIGIQSTPQVDFWIPIFLFAMVFGLSMDYEVFLLSRMREEWDKRHENEQAVAFGLEHTGRIITACAIIMVAAFSGFIASSFVSLQEFGVGLAVAIFLDATLVRAILVPAFMKVMGDWNWYLPDRVRRALRLRPGSSAPVVSPAPGDGGS